MLVTTLIGGSRLASMTVQRVHNAGLAQLAELQFSKLNVAGSNPAARSTLCIQNSLFYTHPRDMYTA